MDFDLTEQQRFLQTSAREVLRDRCSATLVRDTERDTASFSRELWREVTALGWFGVAVPEAYGGSGGDFLDLAVLLEELGRALAPLPYVDHNVAALVVSQFGSEAQKQRWLPRLASGELVASIAVYETSFTQDLYKGVATTALPTDGGYVLDGTKVLVRAAQAADVLLVVARLGAGDSLGMFLVETAAAGIGRVPQHTIDGSSTADVRLTGVRVGADALLGTGQAVIQLMLLGAAAECFAMLGGAQWVLDTSVGYAKERVQFNQPIGAFQAVQHRLANMAIQTDAARFTAYQAGWRITTGLPAESDVRMAKAWVSDAYTQVCFDGHQVHGAIGFTADYDLQLYTRRARLSSLLYGDAPSQRQALASL
jgi:alkylation response protein AidB-like acyl-CoA dehydrogenase